MTLASEALRRVIYVSQSRIPAEQAEAEVAAIVRGSIERNRALGVTGALIFTGHRFAQWLEGPPASIDALMRSIRADQRHLLVAMVADDRADRRVFPDWELAFAGRSHFVDRCLKACMAGGTTSAVACAKVEQLLREFAHTRCAA